MTQRAQFTALKTEVLYSILHTQSALKEKGPWDLNLQNASFHLFKKKRIEKTKLRKGAQKKGLKLSGN